MLKKEKVIKKLEVSLAWDGLTFGVEILYIFCKRLNRGNVESTCNSVSLRLECYLSPCYVAKCFYNHPLRRFYYTYDLFNNFAYDLRVLS